MQPTIGRWHTRYRVAGEGRAGVDRMEHGVRERVAESYATALDQVFGDDPAVYVLRRVRTELTVVSPTMADERSIARAWGERTCAAVVRTVTRHGDDASLVMRFEDTSAFIAQWIADLLAGVAWDRWYYGAFSRYRGMSVEDAIRAVLLEHRMHLPAILRRLATMQQLPLLLSRISMESARELWHATARSESQEASSEQFRVFVRAALSIVDALQLRVVETEEQLFAEYVATSPPPPDWKQTRALAETVFAVLAFLERRGYVRVDRTVVFDPPREVIAALEWLDSEWLVAAVEAWLREETREVAPARPRARTALQQRIVDVLRQLLASGAVVLPDCEPVTSERNALALFAALAAAEPSLAEHPAAPAIVESVLQSAFEKPIAAAVSNEIHSAYAGLFLLTRAVIDARLTQLALALGFPIPAVLLSLAEEWQTNPRDPGVQVWSAAAEPPLSIVLDLDPLRQQILRLMQDRSAFAPSLAPDENATIATNLLRLWSHWLPGLSKSSPAWLLTQFILRPGILRIDEKNIAVALKPAPLDIVLEMAGYLAPITTVPWLDDRRITFQIDRSLA